MKFLSFFLITFLIIINISVKLLIVDQEAEMKNINKKISEIDLKIEKKLTDISYSTRPQILEQINEDKFKFVPILQSDIIKPKAGLMFKSDGINYDNVRPKTNLLSSKKINFHDKKDLIKNVKREKSIRFSKKSNLIFFSLCISFSLFISFNILKVTYKKEINPSQVQAKIKINRGKILDRNNEIIATSIDTNDLYVDIKKSLDKEKLKKRSI